MARVGHHGIWVPGEPVCKAGKASSEEGWRTRPSPYRCSRGWRWGCAQARALNESTVLPPWAGARGFNVTGLNYLAHPILKLEEWSLSTGNEPSHCA